MTILDKIRKEQVREERHQFSVGDTIRIHVKIVEGNTERIQQFQGVERVFPINSPRIAKIEVIRRGDVRRAKLYYLRDKIGRDARVKELRTK